MDGPTMLVLYYMFVGRLDTTCARAKRAEGTGLGGGMARGPRHPATAMRQPTHHTASPRPFGGSPSPHTGTHIWTQHAGGRTNDRSQTYSAATLGPRM